jgi:hypothetical protein
LGLSTADYLFCDADRRLPAQLSQRGYQPGHTWYFGRLSFDYYLHQAGYRNGRMDHGKPVAGDFAVCEQIPGEYSLGSFMDPSAAVEPIDTLSYYRFPLRTKGLLAGFYGDDRLPFSVNWHAPQKEFVVYKIH